MSADQAEPAAGTHIGAYRIEAVLGRGGMGEVLLAWDHRLRRHVALKRIRSDKSDGHAHRRRFRREARSVARLSHPAIVQIFDIVDMAGEDCIVMEYVEGRGLRELIAGGALDPRQALGLAREIAEGLAEAHRKGLVHRDLKPENVRVTADGRAKILDFGLARALWRDHGRVSPPLESPRGDRVTDSSVITADGALIGTVPAMSPEQASGRSVDHRADLFALGGLLYEMLSAKPPFRGDNVLDTLRRINSEDPPPLTELCPDLPAPVLALVDALLQKDPRHRPANARIVAHEIGELLDRSLSDGAARDVSAKDGATKDGAAKIEAHENDTTLAELPTASGLASPTAVERGESVLRVLVLTDLVRSTDLVERLGDAAAAELWARHDRAARDLLARHDGLEIDKSDGFLLLFERPGDAVAYALAYHQALARLSQVEASGSNAGVELAARVGIHLGEVFLRRNPENDVARGAKPLEVEGLAKPTAGRLMSLAGPRQTLLTRGAFDLARRAAAVGDLADPALCWLAHGRYSLQGIAEPLEICEVGLQGHAPLSEPTDSAKARRTVAFSDEPILGWRPAVGQEILNRPRWILGERLGEGGFGEVWLARHASGEQRVFKFCFESERLRALQREVTLLRLLKDALGHRDDIARVLDWNFDTAPFFLETEYTEEGSLSTWAEEQGGLSNVPLGIRLEIAAQVADALAAAHSVGVLHQDVKPDNVLVVPASGAPGLAPRVRLTDFGIARLTDQGVLEGRAFTAQGFTEDATVSSSGAGTRLYMAPEVLAGGAASIQADIYSLGVLVYQLAAGAMDQALAPGWRRTIPDALLVEDLADMVDGTPARRPASATAVAERLRSLEVRRARRAEQEQQEQERQRQQQEIKEARRALDQARRRRRRFAAAAATAAVFLIVTSYLALLAERARVRADKARGDAEELIDFMLHDLPQKLRPVGRLDVLNDTADKALKYFAALDPDEMSDEQLIQRSEALRQIGSVRLAAGELAPAQGTLAQSLTLIESLIARRHAAGHDDPALHADRADTEFWLGYVRWKDQDPAGALEAYEKHRQTYAELVAREPDHTDWRLELAYGHMNVGDALIALGRPPEALEHQRRSLELMEALSAADPSSLDLMLEVAQSHQRVGDVMARSGETEEAVRHYRANLEIMKGLASRQGEDARRRHDLALAYGAMGWIWDYRGDHQEAIRAHSSAVTILRELADHDAANAKWHQQLVVAYQNLGASQRDFGDLDAALESFNAAMTIISRWLERDPTSATWQRRRAVWHRELARHAWLTQDLDRVEREARSCVHSFESFVPKDDLRAGIALSTCHSMLADVLEQSADPVGARVARVRALETIEPLASQSYDAGALERWSLALFDLGQRETALQVIARLERIGPLRLAFKEKLARHGQDLMR